MQILPTQNLLTVPGGGVGEGVGKKSQTSNKTTK